MDRKRIKKFTGKSDKSLSQLKQESKAIEDQIKAIEKEERRIKAIEREKQRIIDLKRTLKEKSKKKSRFRGTVKKLKKLEGEFERSLHPERFRKDGRRKKGSAGRQ